jgi:hypothetical protein
MTEFSTHKHLLSVISFYIVSSKFVSEVTDFLIVLVMTFICIFWKPGTSWFYDVMSVCWWHCNLGVMFDCVLLYMLQAKYDTVLTSLKFCSTVRVHVCKFVYVWYLSYSRRISCLFINYIYVFVLLVVKWVWDISYLL